MHKKLGIMILCGAMTFSLIGCGLKNKETDEATPTPSITQEESSNEDVAEEPTLTKDAKKLYQFKDAKKGDTIAEINIKDFGTIKIKLFEKKAPKAVENFITHAKDGYYDGVTFHRIIDDFMIQGGDPLGTGTGGESIYGEPFEDEFSNDLYPFRGALCMANSGANTNGSQFFIVQADSEQVNLLKDLAMEYYNLSLIDYVQKAYGVAISSSELNQFLTYGGTPWLTRKHTVFGQVLEGFDVLDAIAETEKADNQGTPKNPVVIETIKISEVQ